MDSVPPPILRLPAEVLFEIISLVVTHLLPLDYGRGDRTTEVSKSPFHAVRSTCRTFRWIVDELPFWKAIDFDIREIEYFRLPGINWDMLSVSSTANTEVLLSDVHLQQCLGRKTCWQAYSPAFFKTISRKIPHFGQSVQDLRLLQDGTGITRPRSWLDVTSLLRDTCPVLARLFVESAGHIHLNTLPHTLEFLEITESSRSECDCKNDLPNLGTFLYVLDSNRVPANLDRILPIASKSTLDHLDITWQLRSVSPICQFEKLTHLTLNHSTAAALQSVAQCPFRLHTFVADQWDDIHAYFQPFLDLLKSPVMTDVENLNFEDSEPLLVACTPVENFMYGSLIEEIANLPALKDLRLYCYPLEIDWLHHFRESHCLESIWWTYCGLWSESEQGYIYKYEGVDLNGGLRNILPRSGHQVRIWIET